MAKGNGMETIIAHGVRIEGEFTSPGDVTIEGELQGVLKTAGNLRVGAQSKIRAEVSAQNAHVEGEVRGNLGVTEKLSLTKTARVIGDIAVADLSVESGAQINGTVTMGAGKGE